MAKTCVTATVALCLAMLLQVARSQFGGGGMPKKEVKIIPARKEDIKYVQCGVCEQMVKSSIRATKALKENATLTNKFNEGDILDKMEKMCNPDLEPGEWINNLTISHKGDKLKVVDMGHMGKCDVECRTIARACTNILEDVDITDFSPMLYRGQKRSELTQFLCYESSDSCSKKAPKVPESRKAGGVFQGMEADEVTRYRMMRTMKENGMSGTMYDRNSIMDEMESMKEEMGDEFPDDLQQEMADAKAGFSAQDGEGGGLGAEIGKVAGAAKEAAGKIISGATDSAKKMATKMYNKIIGEGGQKQDL